MLLAAAGHHPPLSLQRSGMWAIVLPPCSYGNHCLNYDLWDYSDLCDYILYKPIVRKEWAACPNTGKIHKLIHKGQKLYTPMRSGV